MSCCLLCGCIRAGYSEADRRGDSSTTPAIDAPQSTDWRPGKIGDGAQRREASADASPATTTLDKDHDSCEFPAVVDFAKINNAPHAVLMNHTGATNVHEVACCQGLPDLVLEVINVPNMLALSCPKGSGDLRLLAAATTSCPPSAADCVILTCGDKDVVNWTLAGHPLTAVLCRSPSDGTATLTLESK